MIDSKAHQSMESILNGVKYYVAGSALY